MRFAVAALFLLAVSTALTCSFPFALTQASGDRATPKEASGTARPTDHVSVRASGRGHPAIRLSDGREILTSYEGTQRLKHALQQNLAQPLSLAAADFDEDGVPDLVSGFEHNGRGIVSFTRGNVDAIYPNAPEAGQRRAMGSFIDRPFLSPAQLIAAPFAPNFLAPGEVGHCYVTKANRRVLIM